MLPADIKLALRYLRPKRSFVSLIPALSIMGPMFGVAVLIVVLSVMNGFTYEFQKRLLGSTSHLTVISRFSPSLNQKAPIEDPHPVIDYFTAQGIKCTPAASGQVLIQKEQETLIKLVKGIFPESEKEITNFDENMVQGHYDIDIGEALIGKDTSLRLGLVIGDRILLHSPARLTKSIKWNEDGSIDTSGLEDEIYLPEEVEIIGIFDTGLSDVDDNLILIHMDQATDLFGIPFGGANVIEAKTDDPFKLDKIVDDFNSNPDFPLLAVYSWKQLYQQLFEALRSEKSLMTFVLSFIVLAAGFMISAVLITVVTQKTREIGILKSIGMNSFTISRIFIIQGKIIGLIGVSLGILIGLFIVEHRESVAAFLSFVLQTEVFPKKLYHLDRIPAKIVTSHIVWIAAGSYLTCIIASVAPALVASFLNPVKALQDDN